MDTMSSNEIAVPLAALNVDGEDGKSVSPEIGDPVDFTATGTVSRVDGENAYISLESVNDTPVTPPAPDMDPMAMDDPTETDMRAMATKADDDESALY